jgi:hypothetical protein
MIFSVTSPNPKNVGSALQKSFDEMINSGKFNNGVIQIVDE